MANNKKPMSLTIEGARLYYKDFKGTVGEYNPAGKKTFGLILDEDTAKSMAADGWTVKEHPGREEDDATIYWIKVEASYKIKAPRVVLIQGNTSSELDESTINSLDYIKFSNVDLIIDGSHWEMGGKSGVKAYLRCLYATVEEDELSRKYSYLNETNEEEDIPFN